MSTLSDRADRPGHSIRPFELDDADWIAEACRDSEIARWTTVPNPYRRDHAVEFIQSVPANDRNWAICDADGRPVGSIGVRNLDTPTPDIGYWVAPWGRGRGATRDALALVLDEISDRGDFTALQAVIADTNAASQAVVRSAGFTLVGHADRDCPDGDCEVPALLFERRL